MAIRIQREVGGNLSELLNKVAETIREREYLERQVKTLSAEGRLSVWILGGLPPGLHGLPASSPTRRTSSRCSRNPLGLGDADPDGGPAHRRHLLDEEARQGGGVR